MALHVAQNEEQLLELRESWDSLTTEPLLSFDWNYEWWRNFGKAGALQVYWYEQRGAVVGIAPFFVDNWLGQKSLRLLGSGATATDYTRIIVKPGFQDEVVAAIAGNIEQLDDIRMVELEGVRGSTDDRLICDRLGASFWRYDWQLEPSWVLELPADWDAFLRSTRKSLRRKIRKALKRLDEGQATVKSTRDGLEFETAFELLEQLHQQRFRSKGHQGVFEDPRFAGFLKSAARSLCEKNKAEILICEIDETPIVAQFYLLSDSGPQLYQSGFRIDRMHLEPGHLLFTFAVRCAIESDFSQFDFLRGNEAYKSFWGAKPVSLYTVRCVSNRLTSTFPHQVYRCSAKTQARCAVVPHAYETSGSNLMIHNLAGANANKTPSSGSKVPQIHFRTNEPDLPQLSFSARFIETLDELEQLETPWIRLIEMAVRKNPFFDPGFLIPAFRHLNQNGARVLVVNAPPRVHPDGPPVVCALFPVIKKRIYGLPFSCLEIWKHDQCFDCTPLIRRDCAKEVLEFVFELSGDSRKNQIVQPEHDLRRGRVCQYIDGLVLSEFDDSLPS